MRGPNGLITTAPTAHVIHQVGGTHGKIETLIVLGATALFTQHTFFSLSTCRFLFHDPCLCHLYSFFSSFSLFCVKERKVTQVVNVNNESTINSVLHR